MSVTHFIADLQAFIEGLPLPPGYDLAAISDIPISDEIVAAIRRYLQERTQDALADIAVGLEEHATWAYTEGATAGLKRVGLRIDGSRVPTDGLQAVLAETRPVLQGTFGGMTDGLLKTLRQSQLTGRSYDETKKLLVEQLKGYRETGIPFHNKGQYKRFIEVTATGKLKESQRKVRHNVTIKPENYADILTKTVAKRAYARGHLAGYQTAGITAWRYQAVGDERTRPRHLALHGRVFIIGSAEEGLALEVMGEPRCRCRPIPYFGDPLLDEPEEAYKQERSRWAKEALEGVDPESKNGKLLQSIAGGKMIKPPEVPVLDPFAGLKPGPGPAPKPTPPPPKPAPKPVPKPPAAKTPKPVVPKPPAKSQKPKPPTATSPASPPKEHTLQAWEPYLKKQIATQGKAVQTLTRPGQNPMYRADPKDLATRIIYGEDKPRKEIRKMGLKLWNEQLFDITGGSVDDRTKLREFITRELPAVLHEDVIRKAGPVKIVLDPKVTRAFYRSGERRIVLPGRKNVLSNLKTLMHEYGHHVQHRNSEWAHNAMLAMRARSKGYNLRKMKDLVPGAGYEGWEQSFQGFDHISPYAGKPYWSLTSGTESLRRLTAGDLGAVRSGEVISMGLEQFYTTTSARTFLEKDPEWFAFMLSVMGGLA